MAQSPPEPDEAQPLPEGENSGHPEGSDHPEGTAPSQPKDQPEDSPDGEGIRPKAPSLSTRIIKTAVIVVVFFGIWLLAAVPIASLVTAEFGLRPGKCVALEQYESDSFPGGPYFRHHRVSCDKDIESSFVVVSNPAARQDCDKGLYRHAEIHGEPGSDYVVLHACLAPVMHEGNCYVDTWQGVKRVDCVPGRVKAVKVLESRKESLCPEGTTPLRYPEAPILYCLARVK